MVNGEGSSGTRGVPGGAGVVRLPGVASVGGVGPGTVNRSPPVGGAYGPGVSTRAAPVESVVYSDTMEWLDNGPCWPQDSSSSSGSQVGFETIASWESKLRQMGIGGGQASDADTTGGTNQGSEPMDIGSVSLSSSGVASGGGGRGQDQVAPGSVGGSASMDTSSVSFTTSGGNSSGAGGNGDGDGADGGADDMDDDDGQLGDFEVVDDIGPIDGRNPRVLRSGRRYPVHVRGPRKVQCPHCDKAYVKEGWLINHLAKVHGVNQREIQRLRDRRGDAVRKARVRPRFQGQRLVCPARECAREFLYAGALKAHIVYRCPEQPQMPQFLTYVV